MEKNIFFSAQRSVRFGPSASTLGGQPSQPDPDLRSLMMVVGLGYQVLVVLLETDSSDHAVRPDPFYVDQALNTLELLVDMGIPLVCNKWLTLPSNPAILNLDEMLEPSSAAGRSPAANGQAGVVLRKAWDNSGTDSPRASLDDSLSLNQVLGLVYYLVPTNNKTE